MFPFSTGYSEGSVGPIASVLNRIGLPDYITALSYCYKKRIEVGCETLPLLNFFKITGVPGVGSKGTSVLRGCPYLSDSLLSSPLFQKGGWPSDCLAYIQRNCQTITTSQNYFCRAGWGWDFYACPQGGRAVRTTSVSVILSFSVVLIKVLLFL